MLDKPHPPLTVEALVAWLRSKPADEPYVWSDPVFCLMGTYMSENGSAWGAYQYSDMPNYEAIAETKPWTFGAALKRAEHFLLPTPKETPLPEIELEPEPLPLQLEHIPARELIPAD